MTRFVRTVQRLRHIVIYCIFNIAKLFHTLTTYSSATVHWFVLLWLIFETYQISTSAWVIISGSILLLGLADGQLEITTKLAGIIFCHLFSNMSLKAPFSHFLTLPPLAINASIEVLFKLFHCSMDTVAQQCKVHLVCATSIYE